MTTIKIDAGVLDRALIFIRSARKAVNPRADANARVITLALDEALTILSTAQPQPEVTDAEMFENTRAMKLLKKGKHFVVVAFDEPYYGHVYAKIRQHEKVKGKWTDEDEAEFIERMSQHIPHSAPYVPEKYSGELLAPSVQEVTVEEIGINGEIKYYAAQGMKLEIVGGLPDAGIRIVRGEGEKS